MAATATSQVTDERELDSDGQEPEEAILADEAGEDFDLSSFAEEAKRLAEEEERARGEQLSAAESLRRAQAREAKRLADEAARALAKKRDTVLAKASVVVSAFLSIARGDVEDKAECAKENLLKLAGELVEKFPELFANVTWALTKMTEFAENNVILQRLATIGNNGRMLADFLRACEHVGVHEIDEAGYNELVERNSVIDRARKAVRKGKLSMLRLANEKKIMILSYTYKVGGEEQKIAFAAGKPFAYKVLCLAEDGMYAEKRLLRAFWQTWKRDVLSQLSEPTSVTDLFTRPELTRGHAEITMFFSPERDSDERQMVGLVLHRSGRHVRLMTALHEGKPGVPCWFDEFVADEGEKPQWFHIGVDEKDPDLSELPRELAYCVRSTMRREGFAFPDRRRTQRPQSRQHERSALVQKILG